MNLTIYYERPVVSYHITNKMKLSTNNKSCFVSSIQVPCRKYFTENIIPNIHERTKKQIHQLVTEAKWISLTSDIWTSQHNNYSFISFTAHWIDDDFENSHAVLNCKYFPGSHTGARIQYVIGEMLTQMGIAKEKVHLLVRYFTKDIMSTQMSMPACSFDR
jgi:hypothetical protein